MQFNKTNNSKLMLTKWVLQNLMTEQSQIVVRYVVAKSAFFILNINSL